LEECMADSGSSAGGFFRVVCGSRQDPNGG